MTFLCSFVTLKQFSFENKSNQLKHQFEENIKALILCTLQFLLALENESFVIKIFLTEIIMQFFNTTWNWETKEGNTTKRA